MLIVTPALSYKLWPDVFFKCSENEDLFFYKQSGNCTVTYNRPIEDDSTFWFPYLIMIFIITTEYHTSISHINLLFMLAGLSEFAYNGSVEINGNWALVSITNTQFKVDVALLVLVCLCFLCVKFHSKLWYFPLITSVVVYSLSLLYIFSLKARYSESSIIDSFFFRHGTVGANLRLYSQFIGMMFSMFLRFLIEGKFEDFISVNIEDETKRKLSYTDDPTTPLKEGKFDTTVDSVSSKYTPVKTKGEILVVYKKLVLEYNNDFITRETMIEFDKYMKILLDNR